MESKAKNGENPDSQEPSPHHGMSSQVFMVKLVKAASTSSDMVRFDGSSMSVRQTRLVNFTSGDQQSSESLLGDNMEEEILPHPQPDSLPNLILNTQGGGRKQIVVVKRSTTILDDDEPVRKQGWCCRIWTILKKRLTPTCIRPRRRR
uniref:Uncharacterized protein n=1 Tax=Branchiostoma floridae TaxID=7739 RepID=C3Z7L0_BRAFL|eukprot:XP_002595353.1 hypothetical protein BRAFLDRAFT_69178 [Branchiostoma floridae]